MIKATQFKQLHPKDADVKHMGPEPLFLAQPFTEDRKLALMKSLGWYSYYYSNKEAKSFIQSWLINNGNAALSKQFTSVSDNTIIPTYGWLARMNLAGLELTSVENEKILHIVKESIEKNKENIKENAEGKVVSNRPDVQEIMRERARDAAGEIEGIFDDYIITDIRANVKPEIRQILAARNIMAQHINIIKASWNNKLKELELVLTGTGFYITPTQDGEPVNAVEVGDGDSHAVDAHTPQSNGYLVGYLTGNSIAPNGLNVTPGVSFPANPSVGEYALRLDYFPNRLFRFDGVRWVKIEDAVRTDLTPGSITNRTLRSGFVNNIANINTIDRGNISSRQSLSDLLKPTKDN